MTDINDVIKTIDELIDGGVLTQYAIAREAGISDGTLSAFRKGKYKGDNAAVAASLRSWYENWNKQSALPEPPQFVETQTVQELRALFQAVRLMGCINVIVGVPGVGKTATARNYCKEQPNTWMITLSPAHSSVTECLLELADALGIGKPENMTPAQREVRAEDRATSGSMWEQASRIFNPGSQSKPEETSNRQEKNNLPQLARQCFVDTLGCDPDWLQLADQDSGLDWRTIA